MDSLRYVVCIAPDLPAEFSGDYLPKTDVAADAWYSVYWSSRTIRKARLAVVTEVIHGRSGSEFNEIGLVWLHGRWMRIDDTLTSEQREAIGDAFLVFLRSCIKVSSVRKTQPTTRPR